MAKIRPEAIVATGFWEYRISGGQYTRASVASMSPRDAFHAVVETPTVELAEGDTFATGDYLWDGTKFRKGTSGEIAAFATAEAADKVLAEKAAAKSVLLNRRDLAAVLELMRSEINIVRTHAAIGLSARTKNQLANAIDGIIDAST